MGFTVSVAAVVYTIRMAVVVYTRSQYIAQGSGFQDYFKPYITILEGPVFRPSSTSVFALVSHHDTNVDDNMDLEAGWSELANKAWVSET